jgi:hypothetical protein
MNDFDDSLRTLEHVFPESIGGTITINDLCKDCNDHLGSNVDSSMVNNWFIDCKRFLLKLPGKDGRIPNPFENLVLASDPNQPLHYRIDNNGNKSIYLPTKLDRSTDPEGKKRVSIRMDIADEDKIPIILEKIRSRASKNGKEAKIEFGSREDGQIEQPMTIHTTLFDTLDWQRGVLKIAYELTYRQLGASYLAKPIAANLRALLRPDKITERDFEDHPILGSITFVGNRESFPLLSDPDSLYAALLPIDNKLSCFVRVFDIFQGLVLVSEQFSDQPVLDGIVIHIDVARKTTIEIPYYKFLTKHSNIGRSDGTQRQ